MPKQKAKKKKDWATSSAIREMISTSDISNGKSSGTGMIIRSKKGSLKCWIKRTPAGKYYGKKVHKHSPAAKLYKK